MFRAVAGWFLTSVSALFVLYLCLHLLALAQLWGTAALPDQWPANLAIAIAVGAIGAMGMKRGVSHARKPTRARAEQRQSR